MITITPFSDVSLNRFDSINSIAYGNGTFVVVGWNRYHDAHTCATSTTGVKWNLHVMPDRFTEWTSVTYGDNGFVAVGHGGSISCATSPDGITWTSSPLQRSTWMSVCYGNGRYVAIGQNGRYRCAISTDGIKWRHFTNPVPKDVSDRWRAICYGGSTGTYTRKHDHHRYVAVGDHVCAASTDGMTWIVGNIDNIEWRDICYGNGIFITVGDACDGCRVSRDGLTWNESYGMGETGEWRTICYGDGMCIATNDYGLRYMVMSFNDTREWSCGYHLCPSEARDMAVGCSCYANGMAVLMSVDGGMVTHVIVQRRKRKPLALSEAVSVNVPLRKVKRVVWKVVKSTVRSKRKGATVSECDDTSMTTEGVSL